MSEETRGAYTPQVGDTVHDPVWGDDRTAVVKFVGDHFIVGDKQWEPLDGNPVEGIWALDRPWVKVEPTPADCWVVVSVNGDVHPCDDQQDALTTAAEWNARPDFFEACPWRVARFSFAGWED